jgi:lipoate-protein ligase A
MPGLSRPRWRLLDTGAADGFTNMAVDEAMLEIFAAEGTPATVRFYSWSPPALSLGYAQSLAHEIDLGQCASLGIDVVRRPTGGQAVLHDHEVTYSVVISGDEARASAGVLAAYLTISQAMIRGLSYLGITAELLPLRRGTLLPSDHVSPVCFATPSSYEVAVGGRKIIGSAQRRAHGAIMQHGSIPLSWDLAKMSAVFGLSARGDRSSSAERMYHTRMTSLQEAGRRTYAYAEVVAALAQGIADTWEVELIQDRLTPAELQLSAKLRDSKYRSDAWTWHRGKSSRACSPKDVSSSP